MHVCFVNAQFPPTNYGGAENYVLRTATELQRRGHRVDVLTTKPYDGINSFSPQRDEYEGVTVWRFTPANVSYRSDGNPLGTLGKVIWHHVDAPNLHAARTVGKTLDRLDPDIVHTNNLMGISTVVGRAIQRRDVAHVHTLHDYSLLCPKSNLLRELTAPDDEVEVCHDSPTPCRLFAREKRALFGTCDAVTGPSQHVIDVHRDRSFFADTSGARVRLGVESVADETPGVPDSPAVLYVGKHLRAKGLDTLFEAAKRLEDVTFHVCGTGPYDSVAERASRALENVEYHGYVSDEELQRLRRRVSVAVVPSLWMENSPLTIYESFAVGLPVVGSDIGGIPELVRPDETGELFEPGNDDELVRSIEHVVGDEDRLRALQQNALDWAAEHTMRDHVDRLVERIYLPAVTATA